MQKQIQGFMILDRFNLPWNRTLYRTQYLALESLKSWYSDVASIKLFKIVPVVATMELNDAIEPTNSSGTAVERNEENS